MKHISIPELKDILNKDDIGNVLVVDVRMPDEYSVSRIPGVVNMPLDEIVKHIDVLQQYDAVYVHCRSGGRSQVACANLEAWGLKNAVNVEGGIKEWERLGLEVIRDRPERTSSIASMLAKMPWNKKK